MEDSFKKIKELENELNIFKQKEQFINQSAIVAKNNLEVSRHNSEKIILKSISSAWEVKEQVSKIFNLIKQNMNNPNLAVELMSNFINENRYFFEVDETELQKIAENTAKKIVENVLQNKTK